MLAGRRSPVVGEVVDEVVDEVLGEVLGVVLDKVLGEVMGEVTGVAGQAALRRTLTPECSCRSTNMRVNRTAK